MYEADLLLLRSAFLKPGRSCDWAERWEFWNKAFTRHGLNVQDFTEGITDFPKAFAAVHKDFARRKGATIWGDKSPNYYDRLQEMAEAFPDARFIIVWRDPAGTANSILRAAQTGNSYFKRPGSTLRGLIGYEVYKQQHDWLIAHGRAVYDVSYEDLVGDTPAVMKEVCRFLQIPYHDDLANLQGADRSAIFDGQHHAFVKGDKIVCGSPPQHRWGQAACQNRGLHCLLAQALCGQMAALSADRFSKRNRYSSFAAPRRQTDLPRSSCLRCLHRFFLFHGSAFASASLSKPEISE